MASLFFLLSSTIQGPAISRKSLEPLTVPIFSICSLPHPLWGSLGFPLLSSGPHSPLGLSGEGDGQSWRRSRREEGGCLSCPPSGRLAPVHTRALSPVSGLLGPLESLPLTGEAVLKCLVTAGVCCYVRVTRHRCLVALSVW